MTHSDLLQDYYATYYVAEIVNSLTNLSFMYFAYRGLKNCWQYQHDTVFSVAYGGYLLTATGSFMFHATLKCTLLDIVNQSDYALPDKADHVFLDPWQLVDELNMIYTTCLMVWAALSYSRGAAVQIGLGVFLALFCIFITLYYHYLQDPTFHQNVYAALTVFIVFRSIYTMETVLRPSLRKSTEADRLRKQRSNQLVPTKQQQSHDNDRDLQILTDMWKLILFGITMFLSGFGIWALDNKYCTDLRRWRREIGLPWGIVLEGHGWWHLMTSIGAYCYIVWGIWLRRVLNGQQEEYRINWPNLWTLPEVVRTGPGDKVANGRVMNGGAKKLD